LDDALRYLPMSALYDGQHFLLERFNTVLISPESYTHLVNSASAAGSAPSVLAMGLSKTYGGLPPLPGVMPELNSVVHDPAVPESRGPMEGKLLPNDKFTLAALNTELGSGKGVPVVHIASHFVVETGSGTEPYLMLGGENSAAPEGFPWTLSELEKSTVSFHGTKLLTLSACSTAKDYTSRNGTEMDSLGMVTQQKEAEAVLATLWDVNDASTSRLMSDFYARWVANPAAGKAEALRQAQLALLKGPTASTAAQGQRGFEAIPESPSATQSLGYSHPYYWAPFVLIGNFQ
jgi:CHAT domain-containing protein